MTQLREPLDGTALAAALPAGWQLRVVAETGSTNADLLAAAASGAPDRSVLVAERQTAGRGRLDRSWQSPAGAGLTLSALLRPDVPATGWGWLPLLAGVALADALNQPGSALPEARLKWPNDLLLGPQQRKVAGILVQSTGAAAVLGIGINVSTGAEELPVPTATSLLLAGDRQPDRAALLVRLLGRLDRELARWQAAGGDAAAAGLAADYRARCATIGSEVTVQLADRTVSGQAVGVDDAGRLLLRPDGAAQPWPVSAGDVTHLRPASR
ncbi:MAG TPA: biotin--[acetyl-CoA-carboxylase] ligase [Jatrophihabitans sp.]|nr:biotin--[acetyl-CoA-carboxylase] ligase [Jatrophihabitans sp.]